MISYIVAQPFLQDRKIKILAQDGAARWSGMPDTPTMIESGQLKKKASGWYAVSAPAGTPKAIVERIRDDVSAVLRAGVSAKIREAGFEPAEIGPDGFVRMLGEEITTWTRVLDAAGIRPE